MGEKSSGRIAGGAGAVAALAAVGVLFAGGGLVGDGLGPFDLWPDWVGSARPSIEVAARSPDGPGVNPLLPLIPRTQGFRALGSATAALVVAPTAFSAGPDVATAGLVVALAPLRDADVLRSDAGSAPSPSPGALSSPNPAGDVPAPASPSAPAAQPGPGTQVATATAPPSEPPRPSRGPAASPPADREHVASILADDQSSRRQSTGSGRPAGSASTASAGGPDSGPRPVASGDGSTSPASPASPVGAAGTPPSRIDGGRPAAEPASPQAPAASSSFASQPSERTAETGPAPPPRGMQIAGGGGPPG